LETVAPPLATIRLGRLPAVSFVSESELMPCPARKCCSLLY